MEKINNNINFTARMDLKGIQRNLQKWESISEKFASKTQNIDDTFTLIENEKGLEVAVPDNGLFHFGQNTLKKLLKMNDEEIAEKFKKISDIVLQKKQTLKEFHERLDYYRIRTAPDEFEDIADNMMTTTINKIHQDAKNAIDTDKILKKVDLWL